MPHMSIETWELLSYVVTVIGLPLAITVFLFEKRRERANEEEEVHELLSSNYHDFLKLALENPDLRLLSKARTEDLTAEQRERMQGHIRPADCAVRTCLSVAL